MVPVLSSSRVSTSPAASTARPAHGQHVALHQAVHAGDADGRQQRADGGGDQRDQQGDEHGDRDLGCPRRSPSAAGWRPRPGTRRSGPAMRMLRAISFGVLRRSVPSTRAIMRSRKLCAGLLGDAHDDPVGEHARAAGDGAAVAARLADDRGRLAGDRRLVDRGDALDDVAVARDQVARPRRPPGRPGASSAAGTLSSEPATRRGGGPSSRCASRAGRWPGPCRAPRRWPRRGWRRSPSATARGRRRPMKARLVGARRGPGRPGRCPS